MTDTENPLTWLRSIDVETVSAVEGTVSGEIPQWLEGTLIRNGSGLFQVGETAMNHLFDGLSVIHRFAIRQGKATYQNRLLQSDTYVNSKEANRLTVTQFGTVAAPDPCKSILGKLMARFDPVKVTTDNCSVNVCYIGDALYALTETIHIRQIDSESLDVIGPGVLVDNYVAVNHSTAHPHVDEDGTVFNMGNSRGSQGPAYNIVQFPPGSENGEKLSPFTGAKVVATFPARWKLHPSYYHSFGMTDNFFVFLEMPLVINALKAMSMNLRQGSFESTLEWYPKEKTRIYLVERKTGNLVETVYEAPGFFCFHHGNAYEKDGHVIVDVCCYEDGSIITDLLMSSLRDKDHKVAGCYYTRFVLPLDAKAPEDKSQLAENLIRLDGAKGKSYWTSKTEILCEPDRLLDDGYSMELPRINYQLNGKEYRFVYGVCLGQGYFEPQKMLKLDVESREVKVWERDGLSVSEPVFVSRPSSTAEDDGVVLFSALDPRNARRVLLIVLDASTFQEVAAVEFEAAGSVPKDFHGVFTRDGDRIRRY